MNALIYKSRDRKPTERSIDKPFVSDCRPNRVNIIKLRYISIDTQPAANVDVAVMTKYPFKQYNAHQHQCEYERLHLRVPVSIVFISNI